MEISNFDMVRVGSGFPACFDVMPIGTHESHGVYAASYIYRITGDNHYFQLRLLESDKKIGFFAFKFHGMELPRAWKDSTLIWDSQFGIVQNDERVGNASARWL